ncbi:unnamed protein product [Urochloa humidicola]
MGPEGLWASCFRYSVVATQHRSGQRQQHEAVGEAHVFPRQIALFAAGLLFFGATTYDVHRSIKNNEQPPTREQMEALQDYINSKKQ